jgi:hypothetical protein
MWNLQQKIEDFESLLKEIVNGYLNLINARLGRLPVEEVIKHDLKALACNPTCPLYGKMLGIPVCDIRKRHGIYRGCGCVREAKLWSDSPCPLKRF